MARGGDRYARPLCTWREDRGGGPRYRAPALRERRTRDCGELLGNARGRRPPRSLRAPGAARGEPRARPRDLDVSRCWQRRRSGGRTARRLAIRNLRRGVGVWLPAGTAAFRGCVRRPPGAALQRQRWPARAGDHLCRLRIREDGRASGSSFREHGRKANRPLAGHRHGVHPGLTGAARSAGPPTQPWSGPVSQSSCASAEGNQGGSGISSRTPMRQTSGS